MNDEIHIKQQIGAVMTRAACEESRTNKSIIDSYTKIFKDKEIILICKELK